MKTSLAVIEGRIPSGVAREPVLRSLETIAVARGPEANAKHISDIREFVELDLAGIESDLGLLELRDTPLHESARHLLAGGGKRLRPMCVALASRIGTGFGDAARDLGVAAELVHSATLLHDDVVDVGERRRGAPSSRMIWGNAASIFAGDWLLVEALIRVRRAGLPDVLDRALGVLGEMLEAEALQLARRGQVDASPDEYMRVVTGKTASLFRWAFFAGARAGGLGHDACQRLDDFGQKVGIAFQIVDDVLDVDGDPGVMGKGVLGDLREGKITYPLILALARAPGLRSDLARALAGDDASIDEGHARLAARAMQETGAINDARKLAEELATEAVVCLVGLPDTPATRALESVARSVVSRRN